MVTPLLLFLVGLVAGFVDAIAGGGGLLTLPSLFLLAPKLSPKVTLGTNKGQSLFGSGMSLQRYAMSPLLDRSRAKQSFAFGLFGAVLGVLLVTQIDNAFLRPLVLFLLGCVAIFMIVGKPHATDRPRVVRPWYVAAVIATGIAMYDGFFGPGTGTFLILAYVAFYRDPLDAASANAKVVNFASNLSAMVVFAVKGLIVWKYALPMAAGQMIGGWTGAHVTIRHGRGLVRWVALAVSLGLVGRLAWQMLGA
jgi:uncharacterized membrane protein YfcA